eukprot:TRINITY_DN15719_c0_g1_i11.p1 TRINITY_DN15719_c0_g1~~TRINITY_DN15719_c0_g1_i11.p1  ORF type:complete len:363 (-),score=86.66 TRINITY_DN15719_c0_g1_i11:540-1628(-)
MQNIETPWFNTLYRYILGFYAAFVLFWVSTTDYLDWESAFEVVDIIFLSVFTAEFAIRIFGLGITYLFDFVNFLDLAIIIASLILYGIGSNSTLMIVLRLIKILLVIIVKFTGNQLHISLRKKAADPLAELRAMLEDLMKETGIKRSVKAEISWAIDIIDQNRLTAIEYDNSKLDMYEDMWLRRALGKDVDTKTWFDKDLEDALNEMHRENEDEAKLLPDNMAKEITEIRKHITLLGREPGIANKLWEEFKGIDFDENVFCDFMKDRALIYLGFKLFNHYDLFKKFGVLPDNLARFLREATSVYNDSMNSYHNLMLVIGVLHNLHYFIVQGKLTEYLTDLDVMALLLAAIAYCFSHPYTYIF